MLQSIATAGSGLSAQQTRINTIGNNLSNVNTLGFKSTRIDFKDALYTVMESPIAEENENNDLLKGVGVLIGATNTDFTAGSLKQTDKTLDFALSDDGFFTLENADGDTVYSRDGSFSLSKEADGNYLVNDDGCYVLDTNGQRISLPDNGKGVSVSGAGVVSVDGKVTATMNIVDFTNPNGLEELGGNCYTVSENSGQIVPAKGEVVQGYLEASNVQMADEMTLLIRTQRAFSVASRALTTADDMEGLANNMR